MELKKLTFKELAAYIDAAEQELTVRHTSVYDAAGNRLAEVRKPLASELPVRACYNCLHAEQGRGLWGEEIYFCPKAVKPGSKAISVTVSRNGLCEHFTAKADEGYGLSMDIWY